MTGALSLHAPLSGWAGPLDEVPDPVFAERMMGDGLAIDPVAGLLVAPCDAEVLLVPATGHSVTLRAANGAEILIHIGIDTVALQGKGFAPHVATGDMVRTGDSLIGFDLDAVLDGAASLVTPVVLANGEDFAFVPLASGRAVAAGEPFAEIRPLGTVTAAAPAPGDGRRCETALVLQLANGIHARPAARIAALAKSLAPETAIRAHGREANARSPVALMTLGAGHGDRLEIVARGEGAAAAVSALVELIAHGIEDEAPPPPAAAPPARRDGIAGVCAVPGLALGPAAHLRFADPVVAETGSGAATERAALDEALARVSARLAAAAQDPGSAGEIAAAHLALLDDVDILAAAGARIAAGSSAGHAWRTALRGYADLLRGTGSALLRERTGDLLDIERQVLATLAGDAAAAAPAPLPPGAILLADEVLPSQLVTLDLATVAGICTAGGGPTSHAAILAAAAGVPMLVAAGPAVLDIADGATLLLDAAAGTLAVDPPAAALDRARATIATEAERRARERADACAPCRTADGTRIEVFANLGSVAGAAPAVAQGAEGCGLLRTEFLFLDRQSPPGEDEQRAAYQAIADALGDRPLIVRTLDIGGDKPVPYLAMPREENPALGLRGVRTSLWRPDLLDTQLRAILRVHPSGRCRIMLPMVASPAELHAVRTRLDAIATELGIADRVALGIMVETPAAALLADRLAADADFFSVGSNDLTQYALAMDRGNPAVAAQVDGFHPAVLRLIAMAAQGAADAGRPLGVCGALASDPLGAMLLVGLGATELSGAPEAIPAVKAQLRAVTLEACRALARRALEADSPDAVRALARAAAAQGEA